MNGKYNLLSNRICTISTFLILLQTLFYIFTIINTNYIDSEKYYSKFHQAMKWLEKACAWKCANIVCLNNVHCSMNVRPTTEYILCKIYCQYFAAALYCLRQKPCYCSLSCNIEHMLKKWCRVPLIRYLAHQKSVWFRGRFITLLFHAWKLYYIWCGPTSLHFQIVFSYDYEKLMAQMHHDKESPNHKTSWSSHSKARLGNATQGSFSFHQMNQTQHKQSADEVTARSMHG